jgi:hypothetical protein
MAKRDKDGNWIDKQGRLVPPDKIKPIDRIQDEAVEEMVAIAKKLELQMLEAKLMIVARYDQALEDIAKAGKLTRETWKGNSTLRSFSGELVAERSISDRIVLDARLKMVKTLLDEWITESLSGSSDAIAQFITQVFSVGKQGRINTKDILRLLQYDIREPKWVKAMQLLKDSIQTVSSVTYYRFFERITVGTGETMRPIALDFASIKESAG